MDKAVSHKNKDAFTMIELLVVISIIAILATILFSVIGTMETTAKKNKTKALMMKISMALEDYNEVYSDYPNEAAEVDFTINSTGGANPFIQPLLTAHKFPTADNIVSNKVTDVWGTAFRYKYPGTKANFTNTYELRSLGADKTANTSDDIYCRGGEFED